jgi:hypothetical protein
VEELNKCVVGGCERWGLVGIPRKFIKKSHQSTLGVPVIPFCVEHAELLSGVVIKKSYWRHCRKVKIGG